jgi:hypothetical protein
VRVAVAGEGSKGGGRGGLIFGEDGGEIRDLDTYREKMYKHLRYCSFTKIYEGISRARMH